MCAHVCVCVWCVCVCMYECVCVCACVCVSASTPRGLCPCVVKAQATHRGLGTTNLVLTMPTITVTIPDHAPAMISIEHPLTVMSVNIKYRMSGAATHRDPATTETTL